MQRPQRITIGFLIAAAATLVSMWLALALSQCRNGDPAGCGMGEAFAQVYAMIATMYVSLLCVLFLIRYRWWRIFLCVLLAPLTAVAVFLLVATLSALWR